MIDEWTVHAIEQVIEELAYEFRQPPGMLLTEDDLKWQLAAKFSRIDNLENPIQSADPEFKATAVHTEIPWFDESSRLKLKPDITITDPSKLSIRHAMQDGIPFPRKGFHFVGNSIVLELKFYRAHNSPRSTSLPVIHKDIEKIKRLVTKSYELSPETFIFGFVVVFVKFAYVCPELDELVSQTNADDSRVHMVVRSAGLAKNFIANAAFSAATRQKRRKIFRCEN